MPIEQDNEEHADETPTPDDHLVRDRWRLISAVKAWPTTGMPSPQLVDYGHDGGSVLKKAIDLVNMSKPDLTWNHSVDARDVAGYVENATWEASVDIPPGINADLVVDPEYDSKAATGLKRGQLRNGSIGFTMDVQPSHPSMEFYDFVERQGEIVDGEQVRWLPTDLYEVRHMALVPAGTGADKHAGRRSGADNQATKVEIRRNGMENTEFFQSVLERLGIDILLSEDTAVSDNTQERVMDRIDKLAGIREKYNCLSEGLQEFSRHLSDDPLSATEVLNRLAGVFELAERGKRLVEFKQREAVEWFDKAKFLPDKAELTASEQRLRGRLEISSDLDYLEDMISEYREIASKKFELNRSSATEELPELKPQNSEENIDIKESAKKLFG
jgi:hypothetical protein